MRSTLLTAAVLGASAAHAIPSSLEARADSNPFIGRKLSVSYGYAEKLEATFESFVDRNDTVNAAKVRTVQDTGTFQWAPTISLLSTLDSAISAARADQNQGKVPQILGLVLYNLPDRDCSAGESAGELSGKAGLRRYKSEYVDGWVDRLRRAKDLQFAIVVEPDAIGNMVTNQGIPLCAEAKAIQEEGIAYALKKLQLPNVHLYLDASHGGWLGWPDNLVLAAAQFKKIIDLAGPGVKIRGFSTNVSNYNPFNATVREDYTEWSPSWDENHYTASLAAELEKQGLPTRFIVDQSRVHLPGARAEWGEWCNVAPSGLGQPQATSEENAYIDSLTWVKPPGESDGRCGLEGAPAAGVWFDEYVQMLVENAHPDIKPAASLERPRQPWWPN
nr:4-beta-D-glucan cellobiohydrolase [Verruciconidia persicina]